MNVTVVRIYVNEGKHAHEKILRRLHDEESVRGVTMFRGFSGFGRSGRLHTASLLDLSLDLPVVIEFFDSPERAKAIINHIRDMVTPDHILTFSATLT